MNLTNGKENGNILKIGIPKGSLYEKTISVFKKAGFSIKTDEKSHRIEIDDPNIRCILIRAQEIPTYVEEGIIDCGITGYDMILESEAKVKEMAEFLYAKKGLGKITWVVAVPAGSGIKTVKDLEGKRVATKVVNIAKKYLEKNSVSAKVSFSWGTTELKPPELADAIIIFTDSGNFINENNLTVIDKVMESTTRFIASKEAFESPWKLNKMEKLVMFLQGAINAEEKVGLKFNIQSKYLSNILAMIPSVKKPTISSLTESGWMAIEVILDSKFAMELIPKLKKAGAEGIIEYPLNKVIF